MDEKSVLKNFGNNLRAERNRLGLSQDGLANLMGICAGKYIGNIERGITNPKLTTIVAMLKVMNIDFEKLYNLN